MSSLLLVRQEDLPNLPEPIRRYMDDWSRSDVVLGIPVLRVEMHVLWGYEDWRANRLRRLCHGPGHSVECSSYALDFHQMLKGCSLISTIYTTGERQEYRDDD